MDFYACPSIDAILLSATNATEDLQTPRPLHHQEDRSLSNRFHPLSPATPTTPNHYDALGSHPVVAGSHQMTMSMQTDSPTQRTLSELDLTMTTLKSSSQFIASYPSVANGISEPSRYTSVEPSNSFIESELDSALTPPSLISTPITPPTPTSPLLPNFPELGLPMTIYRDIPFSPTVPSFTDCPFQYCRDDIPPSKSRSYFSPSTETLFSNSPMSATTPLTNAFQQVSMELERLGKISKDVDMMEPISPDSQLNMGVFDFEIDDDSDVETNIPNRDVTILDNIRQYPTNSPDQTGCVESDVHVWYEGLSLAAQMQELETTYTQLKIRHRRSIRDSLQFNHAINLTA